MSKKNQLQIWQVQESPVQLLIFILKWFRDLAILKTLGRLFHRRLPRKLTEFWPNFCVLVMGNIKDLPDLREYWLSLNINMSHKNSGDSLFKILKTSTNKILSALTLTKTANNHPGSRPKAPQTLAYSWTMSPLRTYLLLLIRLLFLNMTNKFDCFEKGETPIELIPKN